MSPPGTVVPPGCQCLLGPQAPEPCSLSPEGLGVSPPSLSSTRHWQVAHGNLTLLRAKSYLTLTHNPLPISGASHSGHFKVNFQEKISLIKQIPQHR